MSPVWMKIGGEDDVVDDRPEQERQAGADAHETAGADHRQIELGPHRQLRDRRAEDPSACGP